MNAKLIQPWISYEKIVNLVQLEPMIFVASLAVCALLGYKLFLRDVEAHRHANLKRLFKNLSFYVLLGTLSFIVYSTILKNTGEDESNIWLRVDAYIGLFCIAAWVTAFIKTSRILLFEYLFFRHMREGVPLLLVNLFSFTLMVLAMGWLITALFNVHIVPLLATSAAFSLVLGLALQDTLGNLFAGLAMQFDKPYQIGDWIEVTVNNAKWVGKVDEVSWRATVLTGIGDEAISIPNRLMGQTQISNFSTRTHPICRSQLFRIPHGSDVDKGKRALESCLSGRPGVLSAPAPFAYVFETGESYLTLKLVYYFNDFGKQFLVGDQVISAGNAALESAGLELAAPRISVTMPTTT